MKILDTHVHFWDQGQLRYPWLDSISSLNRPFLPADYSAATADIDVTEIVFVQAECLPEQGLEEADWVATLEAPVKGIVAFAPLELGTAARSQVEQLAAKPLVKAIRRLIQAEAVTFAEQPAFVQGVQLLRNYDLRFDICIKYRHLPSTIKLVSQCPDIPFVLDHIGKPDIAAREFDTWAAGLKELAAFPNVMCKLSGVITEADHEGWTVADIRPYVLHTIECFGLDRVMFGSDWPVVTLAGAYQAWFDALAEICSELSATDQEKIYFENGRRFYGLD